MKVIFLDIDGVLVNLASFSLPGHGSASHSIAHPDCVAALNRILEVTGAFIVVSSVWRLSGLSKIKDVLNGWGVTEKRLLDITPDFRADDTKQRGDEIQEWLTCYTRREIEVFAIIDDDGDMKHLLPYLVRTESLLGLTEYDADAVIALLNGSL